MNKKFLKTVVAIATASMVMFSAVACFAAPVETATHATFDFSTGAVDVTTTVTSGLADGEMVTYLVTEGSDVPSRDGGDVSQNIAFIDQKTASNGVVEFNYVTDLASTYQITSYINMGSSKGTEFTKDAADVNILADAPSGSTVRFVKKFKTNGGWTVVGRINDTRNVQPYGAVLEDAEGVRTYIPALHTYDELGVGNEANTAFFAVTVQGLDAEILDGTYKLGVYKFNNENASYETNADIHVHIVD